MDVGCTPQQNTQEEPGAARRLPFCRIITPRPRRDRGYLPDLRQVRRLAVRLAGTRLEASHGAWQQATFTTSFHLVGVEMTIARNPLHGSGQAALPHPALASGDDAKSPQRIGMTYARRGQPPLDEPAHPLPGDVPCVTAPRERAVPEPAHLEPKHGDRRAVHAHTVA